MELRLKCQAKTESGTPNPAGASCGSYNNRSPGIIVDSTAREALLEAGSRLLEDAIARGWTVEPSVACPACAHHVRAEKSRAATLRWPKGRVELGSGNLVGLKMEGNEGTSDGA